MSALGLTAAATGSTSLHAGHDFITMLLASASVHTEKLLSLCLVVEALYCYSLRLEVRLARILELN